MTCAEQVVWAAVAHGWQGDPEVEIRRGGSCAQAARRLGVEWPIPDDELALAVAAGKAKHAMRTRDALIRKAVDAGMLKTVAAAATGLTRNGIYLILNRGDVEGTRW